MPKSIKVAIFAVLAVVSLVFLQPELALFFASLALSAALSSDLDGSSQPKGFRTSRERLQTLREGAAVRAMAFGKVKVGADAHPIYDTNADNKFLRLLVLNWGEVEGFEVHFLNSEAVALDGAGLVNNSVDGKWTGKVRIVAFHGADSQTVLANPLADYDPWTTDHRLRGCAGVWVKQAAVKATSDRARHLHQELNYMAVLKASNQIFDLRDNTTGWKDNAALVLLWYLRHTDGRNLALSTIDQASFVIAANTCDELVTLKAGGTEKRYRTWGQVSLEDDPNDVIRRMLENMDATLYFTSVGGLAVQISDIAVTADTTFTEGHVLTTEFQAGPRALERFNRVLAVITSGDHGYQEITVPAFEDTADIAVNGKKTFKFELPFCPSHTQAQRLSKKKLRRLNPAEQGTIRLNMAGLFARPGAAIKLGYANAETDMDMRVSVREMTPDGTGVTLDVATIASDYDDWDEAIEEQTLLALPTINSNAAVTPLPSGVAASSDIIDINEDTFGTAIKVTWTSPANDTIEAQIEATKTVTQIWFGRQTVDANQAEVTIAPLENDVSYDIRIRFIGPAGGVTDWIQRSNISTGTVALLDEDGSNLLDENNTVLMEE